MPGAKEIQKNKKQIGILKLQVDLKLLGYDCGKKQGKLNKKTRQTIKKFSKDNNIKNPDGDVTPEVLRKVDEEVQKKLNILSSVPELTLVSDVTAKVDGTGVYNYSKAIEISKESKKSKKNKKKSKKEKEK